VKKLIHELVGEVWTYLGSWLKKRKDWNPEPKPMKKASE
jgi:hypothetical protein